MSMPTILPTGQLHPDLFAVVEDTLHLSLMSVGSGNTLRQMRIGYVKTKLCPLLIPSECPACRQKFFKMEQSNLNGGRTL